MSECKFVNVPKFDELGVNQIYPKFTLDQKVMQYMQDSYPKNRFPDRNYFYTVLNTLYPEYVAELIAHSQMQRYSSTGQDNDKKRVSVTEEWLKHLKSMPYLSRKYHY